MLGASAAWAVSRDWTGGTGDWYSPANWNPSGAPAANDTLNIASGQATLTTAPDLTINGGGAINLSGTGEIIRSTTHWTRVGDTTAGTFNQTGGTASLAGNLVVGINNGAGAYHLSAGQLTVTGTDAYIAYGTSTSSGVFTQTDGTLANSGWLNVGAANGGSGQYTISGGALTTGTLAVGREGYGTMSISQAPGKTTTVTTNGFYLGYYAAAAGSSMTVSGGTLNINSTAYFGREGAATFTQTGGAVNGPNADLIVGYGAADGALTVNGGLFSQTAGNFRVGVDNSGSGKGTFNLVSGDVDLRYLSVAQGNANSKGYVNVGGGTLDIAAEFRVGLGGTGAYVQDGGTVIAAGGGDHFIGYSAGSGTVTVNNGTLRHNGGNTRLGVDTTGTLNINGGAVQFNWLSMAQGGVNSKGYVTMTGGSLDVLQRIRVATSPGTTAAFTQTGGNVGGVTARPLYVAEGNDSSGVYDLLGGTLALGNGTSYVGYGAGSNATLNVAGGALSDASGSDFVVGQGTSVGNLIVSSGSFSRPNGNTVVGSSNSGAGQGNMTISGSGDVDLLWLSIGQFSGSGKGHVTMTGGSLDVVNYLRPGVDGTGTFTQSGGIVGGTTPTKVLIAAVGGIGTYNLDGGTLISPSIGSGGNSTFNFNGGTLKASVSTATWVQGLTNAYVKAGGAIIDTGGFDATIAQSLAHDPALGAALDGGLTKNGLGTLTLSGANTYTGGSTVNAGRLTAGNAAAFGPGAITVNAGATVHFAGYNIANPVTLNGGALYVGDGASGTITLNNVAGNAFRASGNYRLISGKITGPGGVTIDGGDSVAGVAFSNPANDFQGNVTINNTFGDVGRLSLWASEVIPDTAIVTINGGNLRGYEAGGAKTETLAGLNGDAGAVIFAPNSHPMNLRIGYNNASSAYAGVIGAGWDAGWRGISIVKIGSGTLTLSGASTYIGGTTIDAGTLVAGHSSALGSGAVTMNGGTLNTSVNLSNPITLNNTTNTIAPNGNYRLLSGQISGVGGFTVASGGGTPGLELNNPSNNFQGNVTINPGTYLRLTASEVLPNSISLANNGNLRLDVSGGGAETIAGLTGSGSVWVPLGNNATHALRVGFNDTSSSFAGTVGAGGQNNAYLRLAKIGAGTLTLSGANSYGGGTTIDGGRITAGNAAAFGSGAITVNAGGTANFAGYNIANNVTLNGGALYVGNGASGTITLNNVAGNAIRASGNYRVVSGKITGPGGVTIDGGDSVAGVAFSNPANDFQGNVLINNTFGDVGRLRLDASEVIPDAAIVTINGGNLRGHDAGGAKTETLAGLNGDAGAVIFAPNSHPMNLRIGYNDTSSAFAGAIGASWDANWRGISIVKIGSGTLTLSGNSTYVGGTTVTAGKLLANNATGSATGSGNVLVTGGMLGGNGSIAGNVTVNAPGMISAGNSPGHLSIGGAYAQTGVMLAEIGGYNQGATTADGYDWISVGGAATLDGTLMVDLLGGFLPQTGDKFYVFTASGGITDNRMDVTFDTAELLPAQYWDYRIVPWTGVGGGQAVELFVGVPEPASVVLLALGAAALALLGWRRKRR